MAPRRRHGDGDAAAAAKAEAGKATQPHARGDHLPDPDDQASEEIQAEIEQEIAGTLKQFDLPDEQVRLIAPRLRQVFLSVEHTYERTAVESIAEAARGFEAIAPGRGEQLIEAFLDDYCRQTRRQDKEQKAQHVALYAGLAIAALIALALVGGAIYSISEGQVGGAVAFLGAAAISMVAGFIDASTRRRKADRA